MLWKWGRSRWAPLKKAPKANDTGQGGLRNKGRYGEKEWKPPNFSAFAAPTPEQSTLKADIQAISERVEQRNPWSKHIVGAYLQAAVDAMISAPTKLDEARACVKKAEEALNSDLQTTNRLWYLSGLALGVIGALIVTGVVALLLQWFNYKEIATRGQIIPLFTFAWLGSVASVLTRLNSLDLRYETRRYWYALSSAVRPILALTFAFIVFIVLANKIVDLKVGSITSDSNPNALYWVAAFLCGFSERFATDMLDKVPFLNREQDRT
ncbi:MAG: hypothetical protein ACRDGM_02670 [bacterium]